LNLYTESYCAGSQQCLTHFYRCLFCSGIFITAECDYRQYVIDTPLHRPPVFDCQYRVVDEAEIGDPHQLGVHGSAVNSRNRVQGLPQSPNGCLALYGRHIASSLCNNIKDQLLQDQLTFKQNSSFELFQFFFIIFTFFFTVSVDHPHHDHPVTNVFITLLSYGMI